MGCAATVMLPLDEPSTTPMRRTPDVTEFQENARRLRNAVEPVAGGVYFGPEDTRPTPHSGSMAVPSPRTGLLGRT